MGYHPYGRGFLTSSREPAGGQCQVGSLTGAVASERVSEAAQKVPSEWLGKPLKEVQKQKELDCKHRLEVEQVRK